MENNHSEIKAIISDLGGVFLNRGIWIFWSYLEKEFHIDSEKAKNSFLKYYKPYFSGQIPEEEFWGSLLEEIGLKEDWLELRSKLLDFFEVNEDVAKLYKKLRESGKKMVLLSDQTKEWWPFLNNKLGIESYFDDTIVSALVGVNKPDPKIYQLALEASGVKAEECIFIDDLESNLAPAEKIGIKTVLFESSEQLEKDLIRLEVL